MDYLHFVTTRGWLIATLLTNPAWFWFCLKFRQCKQFICFVACFLSGTSYYGFPQKCSCPTRFWRLEAICRFASSGWYSSLWMAEYLLGRCLWISLTQVYAAFMDFMIWSPLCSVCAGRELKYSLFLSQRETQLRSWLFTPSLRNHSISTKELRPPLTSIQSHLFSTETLQNVCTTSWVLKQWGCVWPANPGNSVLGSPFLQHQQFSSPGHKACLLAWLLGWC